MSLGGTATDAAAGGFGVGADDGVDFHGSVAGTYEVTTSVWGWDNVSTAVEVPETESVELSIEPAPFAAVRVLDGSGEPLPFLEAGLHDDDEVVTRTVTGTGGVAVFTDIEE